MGVAKVVVVVVVVIVILAGAATAATVRMGESSTRFIHPSEPLLLVGISSSSPCNRRGRSGSSGSSKSSSKQLGWVNKASWAGQGCFAHPFEPFLPSAATAPTPGPAMSPLLGITEPAVGAWQQEEELLEWVQSSLDQTWAVYSPIPESY